MRRQSTRKRGTAMVAIIRDNRRETAYLRDYSSAGVCLDGVRDIMAGDLLALHCKGAMLRAEVRWVRGQRAGLCFAQDCDPNEKARFLAGVARGQKPAQAARIFGFAEMT